ncbi:HNH endonuclease signature motif containing protein [Gordonia sp. 'Campus']|uniref:HNH endonuclease signature motif containing protein n=1 Tax=Gordonia sp. 'Campus' TaxID=2915824 RepID=UPI001EE3EEF4|nr:HNH endonuclease signature motif containing protein [Gordonia sp. 'Campus']
MAFVEPSAPQPLLLTQYERLHALLDEIAETSSTDCAETELLQVAIEHERAERRMLSLFAGHIVDIDERAAYRKMGCQTVSHFISSVLNRRGEATRLLNRVWAIGEFPDMQGQILEPTYVETAKGVADGGISVRNVDVIVDVMRKIPASVDEAEKEAAEATLAHYARDYDPASLRNLGARILAHLDPDGTITDDQDRARNRGLKLGPQDAQLMSRLTATLDPTTRAMLDVVLAVWAAPGMNNPDDPSSPTGDPSDADPDALAAAAERDNRSTEKRNHDAFSALLRLTLDRGELGGSHHGLPPHLIVTITESALREAAGDPARTATGTLLPIEDAVDLAAEAQHHLAVFRDHTSEVLHLGRARRFASRAQRFAAVARDGGCTHPGCTRASFDCEIHHVAEWVADLGPTDLDNLATACGPHNRAVGRGVEQWTTTIAAEGFDAGRAVWHPPRSHPSSTPRVNHAHRTDEVLDRMRIDVRRRRTAASGSRPAPTPTDTAADPP